MVEYLINGIAFMGGVAIGICILIFIAEIREKIERNKRCGRKWWKL